VIQQGWPADLAPTLNAAFGEKQGLEDQHIRGGQDCLSPQLSMCLNAGGMGRCDAETETLIPTIGCGFDEVAHTLKAEGFDASEDGTGRGTPLVPVQAFHSTESRCNNFPPPDVSPPLKVGSNGGGQPPAIAFSAKDHGGDATEELAPTLRAMPHDASHANGGGQMAVAFPLQEVGKRTGVSTDDPRAGIGIGQDGDPMFTLQAGAQHGVAAYAFQTRIARNGRGGMGDVVNALNAQSGGTGKGDAAPCVAVINHGDSDASTQEINAIATLRALRDAVGEEAFAQWRFGILDTLQSPEVLRAFVYGRGVRRAAREAGRWLDDGALSRPQDLPTGALLTLWEDGPDGRSPQGRELAQQLARQLGQALPVLPHQDTPTMAVRRLTPKEAERLQGFPDNYTAIPWRGKPADQCPDGPRYKALGNSMAVPCMRWIGQRIAAEIATAAKTNSEEKAA